MPASFAAIDPTVSKVAVPDERFDYLVEKYKPKSVIPAALTVTDIAGLVKGAAEGAGLGNAFLSHISAVDGILHVCRAFANDDIIHVEGEPSSPTSLHQNRVPATAYRPTLADANSLFLWCGRCAGSVDPIRDLDIIHGELLKKDIALVSGKVEASRKNVERKLGGKEAKEEFDALEKTLKWMETGKEVRQGEWSAAEIEVLNKHQLLTAKPVIYLVNLTEKDYIRKANKFLPLLADWLKVGATHAHPRMHTTRSLAESLADVLCDDGASRRPRGRVTR